MGVTRPRLVEANMMLAVSRRTTRRHHVFTPDKAGMMAQIFWYCLGVALDKYRGIELYAACLMSSHPHYNIGDMEQQAPDFFRMFHRNLACCTKIFRDWPEEVFNKASTSAIEVLTPQALVHAIAYTLANPVAAFAVRFAHQWPGATMSPKDIGTLVMRVKKPPYWFTGKKWKKEIDVRFVMPKMLIAAYGSVEAAQQKIADEVERLEQEAAIDAREKGYHFAGKQRVLKMRHTKRARSYEKVGSRNPQFMAGGDAEAAKAAIEKRCDFHVKYDQARELWRSGKWELATFPYGTWIMRVFHKARVEPPPQV